VITVTRRTQMHDEATGLTSEVVTTITGSAIEKSSGEADVYAALSLMRAEAPLLLFTPTTYGDEVQIGDTLQWPESGTTYTVRSARHLRPDGVVILSYLVVST
jgi:hypothetical protein